jgi:hypothetical protein
MHCFAENVRSYRRTECGEMTDPRWLAHPQLDDMISLYKEDSWYWISGIKFSEFMLGVERPVRLLLLKHKFAFPDSDDRHTRLEFVDADLEALIADNAGMYGDFWWVDFFSRDSLAKLPLQEFLELLYLKQLGKPLTSSHFPTLQNHFVYIGHDDGWALQLWTDMPEQLVCILAQVLSLKYVAFSGRRSYPKADEAIAKSLVARAEEGLCFDFRNVDAHTDSIPIYSVGAVKNSDDAERFADEFIRSGQTKERLVVAGEQWHHEFGS